MRGGVYHALCFVNQPPRNGPIHTYPLFHLAVFLLPLPASILYALLNRKCLFSFHSWHTWSGIFRFKKHCLSGSKLLHTRRTIGNLLIPLRIPLFCCVEGTLRKYCYLLPFHKILSQNHGVRELFWSHRRKPFTKTTLPPLWKDLYISFLSHSDAAPELFTDAAPELFTNAVPELFTQNTYSSLIQLQKILYHSNALRKR